MRKYKFARVFVSIDAINTKEAIKILKKNYPDEDIDKEIESKKIVIAQNTIIHNEVERKREIQGFVFCKCCNKMHKDGSKQQKHCKEVYNLKEFEKDLIEDE